MGNRSRVRCHECRALIPRRLATPVYDEAGRVIGWLCDECDR